MTAAVLDMLSGELPPTATYKRRWWRFIPGPNATTGLGDFTLVIGQARSRRPHAKEEVDEYAVEETACLFRPGRAWMLLNVTDVDQPDCYVTSIYADGPAACTCKAGECRAASDKHVEAIRAVIKAGGLERVSN